MAKIRIKRGTSTSLPTLDFGELAWSDDIKALHIGTASAGNRIIKGDIATYKSYTVSTQGLGAGPDVYAAGYYYAPATDANLTQASTTVTYGTANTAYAAHAFAVAGGAGSVDTGVVGLRVTGTSINDSGTRTTSDSQTLSADITALSANDYVETTKKWLGTVTFELYVVSGSPTTYSLDFNYGFCKYEDFGNHDFQVTDFECVGYAGGNETNLTIQLLKHVTTGWTYSAAAFSPVNSANVICSLVTDHSTDDQVQNGQHFAYKRANLDTNIDGGNEEGVLVFITTSGTNIIEYMNIHIGIKEVIV